MVSGIIIKGIGGFYYVQAEDMVFECRARGRFRKDNILPMVGDRVDIEVDGQKGSVINIHSRKTELVRPAVSNINQLVVVCSITSPPPDFELINSYLVLAASKGLTGVLCINKIDLADSSEMEKIFKDAGYRVVCTSVKQNTNLDEFKDMLTGKVSAFAGNSGVGKSSLLDAIMPGFKLKTGDVSKIQRGKHTTRHVELFKLDKDSFVLDTPGFSTYELTDIKASELQNYFPEFMEYKDICRFRSCAHISEPGCAVRDALLNGTIHSVRYESYKKIYEKLKKIKEWDL